MFKLGKLEAVTPNKIWKKEPVFSAWLAQKDNLDALGEALEIDLCDAQTEVSVGSFSADIVAHEDGGDRTVIIENQYGATDHDHLGKLLTYAAGHKASVLVWIVEETRDEHRAAVEYLNSLTSDNFAFFLVKLQLYRIGDSVPAPMFTVVERPNNWVRSSSVSATPTRHALQLQEWWTDFNTFAKTQPEYMKVFRCLKPQPHHWYSLPLGTSKANLEITIAKKNRVNAGVYFANDKEAFYALLEQKATIEQELGFELDWQPLDGKKAARIEIVLFAPFTTFTEATQQERESIFAWYCDKLIKLRKVFAPYFRK